MNITKVKNEERLNFLSKHYPNQLFTIVEANIYNYANIYIDGYKGGFWEFYELGKDKAPLMVHRDINIPIKLFTEFTEFDTNSQTASMAITLLALNHLVCSIYDRSITLAEALQNVYDRLHAWVFGDETAQEVEEFGIDIKVVYAMID